MATITDDQLQNLIVTELGQSLSSPLKGIIPTLWGLYAERALVAPRLQYLYTKRHAIDWLTGQNWTLRDVREGVVSVHDNQQLLHLTQMRTEVEDEIAIIEARFLANRTPAVGAISTTTPISPDPGTADPNDRVYRGDPLRRPIVTRI